MTTLSHEADIALEGVIDAATQLEWKRTTKMPAWDLAAAVEHVQERLNKARAALAPAAEKDLEVGQ